MKVKTTSLQLLPSPCWRFPRPSCRSTRPPSLLGGEGNACQRSMQCIASACDAILHLSCIFQHEISLKHYKSIDDKSSYDNRRGIKLIHSNDYFKYRLNKFQTDYLFSEPNSTYFCKYSTVPVSAMNGHARCGGKLSIHCRCSFITRMVFTQPNAQSMHVQGSLHKRCLLIGGSVHGRYYHTRNAWYS